MHLCAHAHMVGSGGCSLSTPSSPHPLPLQEEAAATAARQAPKARPHRSVLALGSAKKGLK